MTPPFVSSDLSPFSQDRDSITIAATSPHFAYLEQVISDIRPLGRHPVVWGGHSDVWKADLTRDGVSIMVAVKVLRHNGETQDVLHGRFRQEVACWKALVHENISPLCGIVSDWHGVPAIVLPWYENGTARQYLRQNPSADPIPIIKDIADGLAYMHERRILHGDLKGSNVMIDERRHARLIDFGLAHAIDAHLDGGPDLDPLEGCSVRWSAPELLSGAVSTLPSDVYAFASTAFELSSGHIPYHTLRSDRVVIAEVTMRGTPPSSLCCDLRLRGRSPGQAEQFLALLKRCWVEAARRPEISEVARDLAGF